MNRVLRACVYLMAVLFCLAAPTMALAVSYPFSDDMEGGTGNWTADTPWAQTTADAKSASTSWVDSFASYYANSEDTSLTLSSSIDLTSGTNPQLQFWARYELEDQFDFVYVELSTDGGGSWPNTLKTFTGYQTFWKRYQVDLSAYSASNDVQVRFRLVSDGSIVNDGIYLDDVVIANLPSSVTLTAVSSATINSLDLDWTRNNDADFDHYEVIRSLSPGVSEENYLVYSLSDADSLSYTDGSLASKTSYYYKIFSVNNLGIYSASNEDSGLTLLGLPYPFFDNLEAGLGNWVNMPPWDADTTQAYSGITHVTDSPIGNYGNDVNLTLSSSTNFNLTTAIDPQLTLVHKLDLAVNDYAIVEASLNGSSWSTVDQWTNTTISSWTRD